MSRLPFPQARAGRCPQRPAQRGATLIVGLIMLLLVTLLAVAGVRMATTHVQVTANEQFRTEAVGAANYALDLAINTTTFTNAATLPNLSAVSLQQVAHASDSQAMAVSYVAPQCQRMRYVKNSELQIVDSSSPDATCLRSSTPGSVAIVNTDASGSTSDGNSLCVATAWELGATAADPQTGASVTVMQGVEVRMEISDAENSCATP